jgi:predicted metal-dependent phosphoesterase TrpH
VGKADLHVHTSLGDGMAEIPALLDYVQEHTDLSVLAVTEHDDLRPAMQARERWAQADYRFELLVGCEVTTLEGHILALYVEAPVPSLQPIAPTLETIHRLGGLAIAPHPLSWLTRSVGRRTFERLLREGNDGVYFDGIETASGSPAARVSQRRARELNAAALHVADVGGSDAHFLEAIGCAHTLFEGKTAEELRTAILARATTTGEAPYPSLRTLGLRNVAHQQWRGIMATPRKMGWGPTIRSFFRRVRV